MFLYIYLREENIPQMFTRPLTKEAMERRKLVFNRRGYLEVEIPREDEIDTTQEDI